ncbi:HNH endonuclease signature motif containing protein [Lysobacter fragariae]
MKPIPELPHTYVAEDGSIWSDHPGNRWRGKLHQLKPADNGRGYLRVRCHGKSRSVHLLVASAYIGPRPDGKEVNHKDGNKQNNRPDNLEYVTHSENMGHCFRAGLGNPPTGQRHHMTTLSEEQVAELRAEYAQLRSSGRLPDGEMKRLQDKYGVSDTAITQIARGKTWKRVA